MTQWAQQGSFTSLNQNNMLLLNDTGPFSMLTILIWTDRRHVTELDPCSPRLRGSSGQILLSMHHLHPRCETDALPCRNANTHTHRHIHTRAQTGHLYRVHPQVVNHNYLHNALTHKLSPAFPLILMWSVSRHDFLHNLLSQGSKCRMSGLRSDLTLQVCGHRTSWIYVVIYKRTTKYMVLKQSCYHTSVFSN